MRLTFHHIIKWTYSQLPVFFFVRSIFFFFLFVSFMCLLCNSDVCLLCSKMIHTYYIFFSLFRKWCSNAEAVVRKCKFPIHIDSVWFRKFLIRWENGMFENYYYSSIWSGKSNGIQITNYNWESSVWRKTFVSNVRILTCDQFHSGWHIFDTLNSFVEW